MLFETLATFYCIVHAESKLAYRNKQVGYALQLSESKCTFTGNCSNLWELQTARAIEGATLSCTEILGAGLPETKFGAKYLKTCATMFRSKHEQQTQTFQLDSNPGSNCAELWIRNSLKENSDCLSCIV